MLLGGISSGLNERSVPNKVWFPECLFDNLIDTCGSNMSVIRQSC